jgi:hypothetical protein
MIRLIVLIILLVNDFLVPHPNKFSSVLKRSTTITQFGWQTVYHLAVFSLFAVGITDGAMDQTAKIIYLVFAIAFVVERIISWVIFNRAVQHS